MNTEDDKWAGSGWKLGVGWEVAPVGQILRTKDMPQGPMEFVCPHGDRVAITVEVRPNRDWTINLQNITCPDGAKLGVGL